MTALPAKKKRAKEIMSAMKHRLKKVGKHKKRESTMLVRDLSAIKPDRVKELLEEIKVPPLKVLKEKK